MTKSERGPIHLCIPVEVAVELVADGLADGPIGEPHQTWNIGGPAATQDLITLVGVFGASLAVADSQTLRTALEYLARWIRRGNKPDPESELPAFSLWVQTPRGHAHIELDEEPTAEQLTRMVESILRRPDAED
jgi:hypothetical protein